MAQSLTAHDVDISYNTHLSPVLRHIQLELRPGTFVGVIGPNGSGKSTLVRALSRVLPPVRGSILCGERDLYAQWTARQSAQSIGVVPQTASAALGFTVREIVEMGRAPHLSPSPFAAYSANDSVIVEQAMTDAGVLDMAGRLAPTLSGGEWQRVLLARALAQDTEILLLDEPTAHLDIHHQMQTLSLARSLAHDYGKSVLAVLHDLNLASEFCDTVVMVSAGRIAAQGSPADVLTSDRLREIYQAHAWVRPHPLTGRPLILALPAPVKTESQTRSALPVHVLCGAGTGASTLLRLVECGCAVTCGPLSAIDLDAEAARHLSIPCLQEAPFTLLSDTLLQEALALSYQAKAIVITEMPFGPANIQLLEIALSAQKTGVPVYCLQPAQTSIQSRDYTAGNASALYQKLLEHGAVHVTDTAALLSELKTYDGNNN